MKHDISARKLAHLEQQEREAKLDERCNPVKANVFDVACIFLIIFALVLLAGYFT